MAFFSWRTGSRDVFVQPFDGGPAEQVTTTDGQESYPRWLPDGRLMFLDQTVEDGVIRGLLVTSRDESGKWRQPEPLVADAFGAAVTADGAIIYTRKGTVEILRPGSREPVLLYQRANEHMPHAAFLAIGEDPRSYYTKQFDAMGRASLLALPLAGGPPTELIQFDDLLRPSSRLDFAVGGGRYFFTLDERRSNIWIADVTER